MLDLEGVTKQNISEPPIYNRVLSQIDGILKQEIDSFIEWFSAQIIWDENKFPWLNVWDDILLLLDGVKISAIRDKLMDQISSCLYPESEGALFLLALLLQKHPSFANIDDLSNFAKNISDETLRLNMYNLMLSYYKADDKTAKSVAMQMVSDTDDFIKNVGKEEFNIIYKSLSQIFQDISEGNREKVKAIIEYLGSAKVNDSIAIKIAGNFTNKYISSGKYQRGNLLNFVLETIYRQNDNAEKVCRFAEYVLSYEYMREELVMKFDYILVDKLRPWATINVINDKDEYRQKWARREINAFKRLPNSEVALAARNLIQTLPEGAVEEIHSFVEEYRNSNISFNVFSWDPPPNITLGECRDMLLDFRTRNNYIDIEQFATEFGLKCKSVMGPAEFFGMLVKSVNMPFPIIIYNQNHHRHVQRFTIAHELSHYFLPSHNLNLHKCIIDELLDLMDIKGETKYEIEANELAAWLLMPDNKVTQYIEKGINGWENIRELREEFDVSLIAMARRIVDISPKPIAIIRLVRNGDNFEINYARGSQIGDFPYWALRRTGSVKRHYISTDVIEGISDSEREISLSFWCDSEKLPLGCEDWQVKEYATKYGENWVLVLLEVLNWNTVRPVLEEDEMDDLVDLEEQNSHKRGFSYRDFFKSKR